MQERVIGYSCSRRDLANRLASAQAELEGLHDTATTVIEHQNDAHVVDALRCAAAQIHQAARLVGAAQQTIERL